MIDEREQRLLDEAAAGTAGPAERERAAELLRRSPEAREYDRELRSLIGALEQVEMEEAPRDLLPSVMASIGRREATPARAPQPGFWAGLLSRRPAAALAGMAAMGLAIGAIGGLMGGGALRGGPLDGAPLTGTMAPGQAPVRHELRAGEARVVAEFSAMEESALLRLEADAPAGAVVRVSFSPADWRPVALTTPGPADLRAGTGEIVFELRGEGLGEVRLRPVATRPDPPLVTLTAAGVTQEVPMEGRATPR
jgi:hypothetical protein